MQHLLFITLRKELLYQQRAKVMIYMYVYLNKLSTIKLIGMLHDMNDIINIHVYISSHYHLLSCVSCTNQFQDLFASI